MSVLDYGNTVYMHASLAVLTCAGCCLPCSTDVYHIPLFTTACMLRLDSLPCSLIDLTSGFFVFVSFFWFSFFFVHFHLTSNSKSFKKKRKKKSKGKLLSWFPTVFLSNPYWTEKRMLLSLLGTSSKIT